MAMKYFIITLVPLLLGFFPLKAQNQSNADSAFIASLAELPADIADITRGLVGNWVERKGKGSLECTSARIRFVNKKGEEFEGRWEVKKIMIGYQLLIYNEVGEVIKSLPIAERNDITAWMLEINLAKYIKAK